MPQHDSPAPDYRSVLGLEDVCDLVAYLGKETLRRLQQESGRCLEPQEQAKIIAEIAVNIHELEAGTRRVIEERYQSAGLSFGAVMREAAYIQIKEVFMKVPKMKKNANSKIPVTIVTLALFALLACSGLLATENGTTFPTRAASKGETSPTMSVSLFTRILEISKGET